jgi:transglutaminase-like putative cysteine protease
VRKRSKGQGPDALIGIGNLMLQKLLFFSALLLSGLQVLAADYSPAYTVQRSVAHYDVKADGSYAEDVQEVLKLNNLSGVEALSQYAIRFSASLQSVRVIEAYTETADGRRLPVKQESMLLQQSSESANAPMFDDSKVLNVVFPALAPGVTVHIHFRRVQHTPLFPGVFALQEVYSANEDRIASELQIRTPATMSLQVESVDVPGGEVHSDRSGTRLWRWSLGRHKAEAPENDAISETDYSPRVAVSSLGGYEQLAQSYLKRAGPKAVVTPAIRQLAEQITAGVTDRRAQAEALYRWVSRNVRYVAIYFGFGGVVPHSADQIAHALYGDCKDHVTIYEALLAARGISSYPVLVNADQSWWLSRAAVPTGSFNHAISYLPEWKLFVDTTAQFAPFGVLPDNEAGKRALVTNDGHGQSVLMNLPLTSPETDRLLINSEMHLLANGSIRGQSRVSLKGVYDYMARSAFSTVTPGTDDSAAARMLSSRGLQGSGSLSLGNAFDLSRPYHYRFDFDLPDYADLSGPTGVILPSGQDSVVSLASFASWGGSMASRRFPVMLGNGQLEENAVLTLPAEVNLLALPRTVDLSSPLGHYHADYQHAGNQVRVHRVLVLNGNAPVLSPERYPLLRQLARAVAHDLRAQLLLQPR